MSTISVRLPDSLHQRLRDVARKDGVSINQLITCAVAEKVSAFATEDYLVQRAARADRTRFEEALSRIPDAEPESEDRL